MMTTPPNWAAVAGPREERTTLAITSPPYATSPADAHTNKYAVTNIQVKANASMGWYLTFCSLWKARTMGAVAGNIIATIMTTHVARNSANCGTDEAIGISMFAGVQIRTAHAAAASSKSKTKMTLRSSRPPIAFPRYR